MKVRTNDDDDERLGVMFYCVVRRSGGRDSLDLRFFYV